MTNKIIHSLRIKAEGPCQKIRERHLMVGREGGGGYQLPGMFDSLLKSHSYMYTTSNGLKI